MSIPIIPDKNIPFVTDDMKISSEWHNYQALLNQELQDNIKPIGNRIPSKTFDEIKKITDITTSPTIIHDSTNNVYRIFIDGVFKKILTED